MSNNDFYSDIQNYQQKYNSNINEDNIKKITKEDSNSFGKQFKDINDLEIEHLEYIKLNPNDSIHSRHISRRSSISSNIQPREIEDFESLFSHTKHLVKFD